LFFIVVILGNSVYFHVKDSELLHLIRVFDKFDIPNVETYPVKLADCSTRCGLTVCGKSDSQAAARFASRDLAFVWPSLLDDSMEGYMAVGER